MTGEERFPGVWLVLSHTRLISYSLLSSFLLLFAPSAVCDNSFFWFFFFKKSSHRSLSGCPSQEPGVGASTSPASQLSKSTPHQHRPCRRHTLLRRRHKQSQKPAMHASSFRGELARVSCREQTNDAGLMSTASPHCLLFSCSVSVSSSCSMSARLSRLRQRGILINRSDSRGNKCSTGECSTRPADIYCGWKEIERCGWLWHLQHASSARRILLFEDTDCARAKELT